MDDVWQESATRLAPDTAASRLKSRRTRGVASALRGLSLCGVLALWWVAAWLAASPQLLPSPERVLAFAWHELLIGTLPLNLGISLARVLAAFGVAMSVGSVLGFLAGRWVRVDAVIDPWMVVALNLPVLLVIVLCYVWLGLNEAAAVLAVAIAKIPTVFVTVREGTRALSPAFRDLQRVFQIGLFRRLRWVTLPQLMPYLAAAGRSGLSITWKIVLIVELLGRPNGVGFVLNLYFQNFNVTGILTYGLSFALIMLIVETSVLQPWEKRANAWRSR